MKLSKSDYEFIESMEYGLKEELKRALDWNDAVKVGFIKGQLSMLRTIIGRDENMGKINQFIKQNVF